jgi:thiol-disulfide isomerase/thioredoxin
MSKLFVCAVLMCLSSLISAEAAQSKPLNFTYVASDGSNVDLADMRGKVVLIFFWATWSQPSRAIIPTILAVRKQFKNDGFEVLGVSLDEDKSAMDTYVDEYNMPWPEYFDGKGTNNDVARTMQIRAIPALWLVGKDGRVLTTDARQDLAGQVQKALKAK